MKLENGMFVICPEGVVSPYLTSGKKYEVFDVVNNGRYYSFKIINDIDKVCNCLAGKFSCAHLKWKHWIIDNPEKL